ncbi:MAG: AbgT family transporter [Ignavibacteria bacterium]|nr:AbgT family transporter [Ignavibacteria bacterium]
MKAKLSRIFTGSLDIIERVGNKLPHPATLFAILTLAVVLLSWIGDLVSLSVLHPVDQSKIIVRSLLSPDGIRWFYKNMVANFVGFPPLGLVLAVMIGIGVAEGSGLFTVLIRAMVLNAPKRYITASLVAAGILSHLASEAGYVILIPLGAALFYALGRHPMAGLAAAFCGVSGGFGANFLIGSIDPVLAGLTQSAAQILEPARTVNPAVNYYFMFASAVMLVFVGTFVTEKIVEPRLGRYDGSAEKIPIDAITPLERKGLIYAGLSALFVVVLLGISVIPENGVLRDPVTKGVLHSPFLDGIITAIAALFFIPGLVYGIVVGTIKNDKDLMKHIIKSMGALAMYIVLVFFAAQFVATFRQSNLGLVLAIDGAQLLKNIGLTGIPLIVAFIVLSSFINLFMGSASAKWAIMAPVFVPMFMLLGYHPALTQAAFRIGDSVTNVITPMMSYFVLIVAFAQKYGEKQGIGTIISTMIPYTIVFLITWTLLMVGWMLLGVPLGPDGFLFL